MHAFAPWHGALRLSTQVSRCTKNWGALDSTKNGVFLHNTLWRSVDGTEIRPN